MLGHLCANWGLFVASWANVGPSWHHLVLRVGAGWAQNVIQENFIEQNENNIKTVVHNPENGWRVFIEYEYIDKDNLRATFSGDSDVIQTLKRKKIL